MTSTGKVELSFEGGTDTIGGNIVILKISNYKSSFRYLFDFGVSVDAYKSQTMIASEPQTIEDFVRRGLIPEFELSFRACFLSHAHGDHCIALRGLINSAKQPYAIWSTKTTSRILKDIKFAEKPLLADPFEKGDYYEDDIAKENGLEMRVALYPVDHDIPGACCFLIIAENNLIIYTGDFRDHGPLSAVLSSQFWQYAQKLKQKNKFRSVSVITEGTNFGLPFDFSSQIDFENRLKEILNQYTNELVSLIVDNDELWDVFSTFWIIRNSSFQRKIVLSKTVAKFFEKIRDSLLEDYRRVVNTDGLNALQEVTDLARYIIYDRSKPSGIELLREISANPSKYLVFLTKNEAFGTLDKICVFSNHSGGCCLLSFSANESSSGSTINTYAEEIGKLGFCVEKTRALARGHISPHRLERILEDIEPDRVFIIHTLAPNGLRSFLASHLKCEVIAPLRGNLYQV